MQNVKLNAKILHQEPVFGVVMSIKYTWKSATGIIVTKNSNALNLGMLTVLSMAAMITEIDASKHVQARNPSLVKNKANKTVELIWIH